MTTSLPQCGDALTPAEIKVLHLTAQGRGNTGTARDLNISLDTAKTHLRRIFIKLDAYDRSHAVAVGFARGYLWIGFDGQLASGHDRVWRAA